MTTCCLADSALQPLCVPDARTFGIRYHLALAARRRWLFTRGLCALFILPSILVAFPRVYGLAWLVVALGMATRLVPFIERWGSRLRRFILVGLSGAVVAVAVLGGSLYFEDRIKQTREYARPMPPPGSPNVLLIVLDTVAAGHLNLHGYHRSTSTTLIELAERGIRFDSARAASSWTLPSHATMFTGRWLHELSVGWLTPLDDACPTLAEFLGDRGYATAGFVGNTLFCAADSGLSRGFTHYQDYIFPELTALKTAVLVSRALEGFQTVVSPLTEDRLARPPNCYPVSNASGGRCTPIARGRQWSIASFLTGSHGAPSRSGRFSLS